MRTSTLLRHKISINESALRALCQKSFFDFVKTFWPAVVNEDPVWNWHIEYLCYVLQGVGERVKERLPKEHDYIVINVPPGSSKSTIATIMYPMWCWCIDPTQRFICASYAEDIALDLANKSKRILDSALFKRLFPDVVLKREALSHLENSVGGERYTAATGSAVTGKHAHQILIDDPLNPKKAASEQELKIAEDFVFQTMSSRKVDKKVTTTIIIMQRLHELDTTGLVLRKEAEGLKVKHICLPGEISDLVKPEGLKKMYKRGLFDPVRLSQESLAEMRVQLGSYGYSGQVMQNPTPEGGGIMKVDWFEVIDDPVPRNVTINFRIDPAYTEKRKNDPTGLMAYYIHRGCLYIINFSAAYKEFPALVEFIPQYCAKHGATMRSRVRVEPKASGMSIVQTLKSVKGLNILASRPPKDDKITRANAAAPSCESGKVKLHRGSWNSAFLHEVCTFPNAAHDEAVDLLCAAVLEELNMAGNYGWKVRR
jgi:predicted phage terminase large subunit-like protein